MLYREIVTVVGLEGDITLQSLRHMTYLEQVYQETLRWSCVAPGIMRKSTVDMKLGTVAI